MPSIANRQGKPPEPVGRDPGGMGKGTPTLDQPHMSGGLPDSGPRRPRKLPIIRIIRPISAGISAVPKLLRF